MKRWAIITYKHGTYELPHELPNDLKTRVTLKSFVSYCGLVINNEKSDFNPKTKGKWLGTTIDTRELTFTVPQEKITKLLEDITMYLNQEFLTPKQLPKVAEQRSFMHLPIGPLVRLFTRNMYHFTEKRIS